MHRPALVNLCTKCAFYSNASKELHNAFGSPESIRRLAMLEVSLVDHNLLVDLALLAPKNWLGYGNVEKIKIKMLTM